MKASEWIIRLDHKAPKNVEIPIKLIGLIVIIMASLPSSPNHGVSIPGKLDTYLWWSYAKGARQQLQRWSSSISTVTDAEDATEVVISCAKADSVQQRMGAHGGIGLFSL